MTLSPWERAMALHKKSWAVIDRPYSLGFATVGALYERPRCISCAKPFQCLPGGCHLLVEFRNQQVAEFHRALLFHSLRVLSSLYCLMLIISTEDIESVLSLD